MFGVGRKIKIASGAVFVLALLVSSVSACACSHHAAAKPNQTSSCHSHATSPTVGSPETTKNPTISDAGCKCATVTPRLAAKSEKKQFNVKPAIALSVAEPVSFALNLRVHKSQFIPAEFTLSFLRTSIKGRAPPRPNFG